MSHISIINKTFETARRNIAQLSTVGLMMAVFTGPNILAQTDDDIVDICFSSTPPYFVETENGYTEGLWPNLLDAVFEKAGLEYSLEYLPRARCREESASANPDYDMTPGRLYSADRAEDYWMTPVYSQFGIVFYNDQEYPDGIPINDGSDVATTLADLKEYDVCGFNGWTYSYYQNQAGYGSDWEPILVDDGIARNQFEAALKMVLADRCDVIEMPLGAFMSIEQDNNLFSQLGCFALTDERPDIVYALTSKNSPRAFEIYTRFSNAVALLNEQRQIGPMIKEHLQLSGDIPSNIRSCLARTAEPLVRG